MSKQTYISLHIVFYSLIVFVLGYGIANPQIMLLAIFLQIISILFDCRKALKDNIIFLLYILVFCVFLLFNLLLRFFENDLLIGYEKETETTVLICIYASLLFLIIGHLIGRAKQRKEDSIKEYKDIGIIQTISFWGSLLTFPFMLFVEIERIRLVQTSGYVNLYNMQLAVPWIVDKISVCYLIFTMMFLATFSSKIKTYLIIFLYSIYLFADVLTGRRGIFVGGIMLIITYFVIRYKKNPKEKIFSKTFIKVAGVIAGIGILVLMGYIGAQRLENGTEKFSILETLQQQGQTVDVIAYSVENKEILKNMNENYSMKSITTDNEIIGAIYSKINNNEKYGTEGAFSNNLADAVTYLKDRIYYNLGGSFGTAYIAELYVDYSYIGIIIYNFLLGYIIAIFEKIKKDNWIYNTYFLMILSHLYFLPRESSMDPWAQILSVTNLLIVCCVYMIWNLSLVRGRKK